MTPSSGSINLLEWLTELRETLYYYWFIIKDVINDAKEQPDREAHRARSGRVPSTEASVPMELGCATLLAHGCVHQPGSSVNAII